MTQLEYYLDLGVSYEDYKERVKKEIAENNPLSEFSSLNFTRMKRVEKTVHLDAEEVKKSINFPTNFSVIIISEGWCGDASQSLPVFEKYFNAIGIKPRYVFRDDVMNLIQQYLTNGALSIPIVIGVDDEGKELFHYGPRPKEAMAMLKAQKEDPTNYTKEEFYKDLQNFYNKDKGKSTIEELQATIQEQF